MADLRFAAWFLWMTFLDAALSSFLVASVASDFASSVLPASTASLKRRTEVLSAERTDLLRSRASSFCRLRLICDLIFATGQACSFESMWIAIAHQSARRITLSVKRPGTQICVLTHRRPRCAGANRDSWWGACSGPWSPEDVIFVRIASPLHTGV